MHFRLQLVVEATDGQTVATDELDRAWPSDGRIDARRGENTACELPEANDPGPGQ